MKTIPITKNRASNKKDTLSDYEKKAYRALVGQLSWVTTHTRPDVAFEACALSVAFYNATIEDLIRLNRVVETLQREHVNLFFPRLHNIGTCTIECYTDAAFNNLPNGNSQGGFIIFLQDTHGQRCPIFWESKKLDRVVKSSMAAEVEALI